MELWARQLSQLQYYWALSIKNTIKTNYVIPISSIANYSTYQFHLPME